MSKPLTTGSETRSILAFSLPLIFGNICQQLYNVADSIIVGQTIGSDALAAVGSSFTLMVFLTSIILGLCMGASVLFSEFFGAQNQASFRNSCFTAFLLIGGITVVLNIGVILFINPILHFIQTPPQVFAQTKEYVFIIFLGIPFVFLYNYFSSVYRSIGNSKTPLAFLIVAAVLNVVLDLLFIIQFHMGIAGAALATIIAQGVSGVGLGLYCLLTMPQLLPQRQDLKIQSSILKKLTSYSILSSIQQSVMNFGILLIQGLVNSFGVEVMAAFAAAVKIESFAYSPVQEYGNAFSSFTAQNNGANKPWRIRKGIRSSVFLILGFCAVISTTVIVFAPKLMLIFIKPYETEIIAQGVLYLRTVGVFYFLIGLLFMFYGLYRGLGKPSMSIVLTAISLGLRVILAYRLAPIFGVSAIWWAIPAGWLAADLVGTVFINRYLPKSKIQQQAEES